MADRYDPLPDLAELVRSSMLYGRDCAAYAERIADRLGIGEDDTPAEIEARLREALGAASGPKPFRIRISPGALATVDRPATLSDPHREQVLDTLGNWWHLAPAAPETQAALGQPTRPAGSAARTEGPYKVEGKDGFDPEADFCPLSEHTDYPAALQAARDRLGELNKSQPGAGGQGGIQDRVYVLHPDGRRERVLS